MKHQMGYISIPKGFIETLVVLSLIGAIALVLLALYGVYWLATRLTITP